MKIQFKACAKRIESELDELAIKNLLNESHELQTGGL
jgi:hypothetical protein